MTERKRAEAEARESERRYRETQTQLAHANRVATMGQLTASIAHEVNQPIAATVTNAQAALRWLGAEPPNLDEVRQALGRIVRDGSRAGAVVGRIRNLIKKAPPSNERVDINAAIREVIELTRSEAMKNGVLVQTELVEGLPPVRGDRVELQQVILNLILNALEAMSEMSEGSAGTADRRRARPSRATCWSPCAIPVRDWRRLTARASLQRLLHDQAERLGPGAVDLPFDYRSARRTIVGERQFARWRRLSVHVARPLRYNSASVTLCLRPTWRQQGQIRPPAAARVSIAPEPDDCPASFHLRVDHNVVFDDGRAVGGRPSVALEHQRLDRPTALEGLRHHL